MEAGVAEWEALLDRADPRRRGRGLAGDSARAALGVYRRHAPPTLRRWLRPLKPVLRRLRPRPDRSAE
jgi:hypothetical protein